MSKKSFLDLLLKAERRLLLEKCKGLSGTELYLIIVALRRAGIRAEILPFGRLLKRMWGLRM